MNSKLLLLLRRQCLCFSFGGLLSISCLSFFFSHQTSMEVGEGEGGVVALLPECVVSYFVPRHTHAHSVSLFLFIGIQYVSSQPRLNKQWKLWGHWFLLIFIIWCTETERKREGRSEKAREESLSSLRPLFFSLSEDALARCPCQAGGRQEKRKWLLFTLEPELFPHSVPPSLCFSNLKWRRSSCVFKG